jgi:splicing factor U2AF subunit
MNVAEVAKLNPQVLVPLMNAANPMTSRQARRIYIGNLPPQVTETELAEFFNTAMMTAKVSATAAPPVVAVQLNHEKGFAFLEFRASDEATAAMAFDGISLQGQALKVRRPKDYANLVTEGEWTSMPGAPPLQPEPSAAMAAAGYIPGIVQTNVPDTPFKIFVGGLPTYLTEDSVKDLLQTFGPLKAFNLVKDPQTNVSKGFAFCEYVDTSVTDRACAGLNGMKIGDKSLIVQRANVNRPEKAQATAPSKRTNNATALNFLNMSMPVPQIMNNLLKDQDKNPPPTRILQLMNVISLDDLYQDAIYNEVLEDVREEVTKFGRVRQIIMARPPPRKYNLIGDYVLMPDTPPPEEDPSKPKPPQQGVGRILVEYETAAESERAMKSIAGRRYAKRTILCSYYPEHLFDQGLYDGPAEVDTNEVVHTSTIPGLGGFLPALLQRADQGHS